jgi:hypothetical protein
MRKRRARGESRFKGRGQFAARGRPASVAETLERRTLLSSSVSHIFVSQSPNEISDFSGDGSTINATAIASVLKPGAASGPDVFAINQSGNISEYTTDGTLVTSTLIAGLTTAQAIAISGSDLFVASNVGNVGTVGEYTLSGGVVNASLISGIARPTNITVSGDDLFIACAGVNSGVTAGFVAEYTTAGAVVNPLLITGLYYPNQLAVVGSSIFLKTAFDFSQYSLSGVEIRYSVLPMDEVALGIAASQTELFVLYSIYVDSTYSMQEGGPGYICEYLGSGTEVNDQLVSGLNSPTGLCVEDDPSVVPGPQLSFASQPENGTVGAPIGPAIQVDVTDASGVIDSADNSPVTLSLTGLSDGVLWGKTTVNAVAGVATFSDVSVSTKGIDYRLLATDADDSLALSDSFWMDDPSLQIDNISPDSYFAGTAIPKVSVAIFDTNGHILTTDNSTMSLTLIGTGSSSGILDSTVTAVAEQGTATFTNIPLSNAGTFYLKATDGPDYDETSGTLTVLAVPTGLVPSITHGTYPTNAVQGNLIGGFEAVDVTDIDSSLKRGIYHINLYLSSNGSIDNTSDLIASEKTGILVKAGGTIHLRVPIKRQPMELTAGTYNVLAKLTDASGNFSASLAGPALTVANRIISISGSVVGLTGSPNWVSGLKSGSAFTVKLANTGNIAERGKFHIYIGASIDGTLSSNTLQINTVSPSLHIAPGQIVAIRVPVKKIPLVSDAGQYVILASEADPLGFVAWLASDFDVNISPAFVALSINQISVTPGNVKIGGIAKLSAKITNNGNITAAGLADTDLAVSIDDVTEFAPLEDLKTPLHLAPGHGAIVRWKLKTKGLSTGMYYPVVALAISADSVTEFGETPFTLG